MESKNTNNNAEQLKQKYLKDINEACSEQKKSIKVQTDKVTRLKAKVAECEENAGKLKTELDKMNSKAAREIAESRPIDGIQKEIRKLRLGLEDLTDLQNKLAGEILPGEEQNLKNQYADLQELFIRTSVALRQEYFDQNMDKIVIELGNLTVAYDEAIRQAVSETGTKMSWGTSVHQQLGKPSFYSEEAQRSMRIVFA